MMRSFGCAQVKIGSYKKCTYIKLVGDKLSNLREIAGEKDIRSRIRLHSASAAQTFVYDVFYSYSRCSFFLL